MLEIYTYLIIILLGLIIGSFLNVLIYRHNTGWSLGGRSRCLSCGQSLKALELIPLISFIWQKGRCKKCDGKISYQYVLVEVITATSFALVLWRGFSQGLSLNNWVDLVSLSVTLLIVGTLIAIVVYDLRHKIIPDKFVWVFIALGFMLCLPVFLESGFTQGLFFALYKIYSGGIFFIIFWAVWYFSRGSLMGFGDAKLVFGLGVWLGLEVAFYSIMSAFVMGAMAGLVLIGLSNSHKLWSGARSITIKSELPFAPFLVLGAFIGYLGFLDVIISIF